jgi:SAM-dependent methyltransferase
MQSPTPARDLEKAALRGEPSYVWRAGQQRRLEMILAAGAERLNGRVLENGCGVGIYLKHLAAYAGEITGLEYDFDRAVEARQSSTGVVCAAGEHLPFPDSSFDLILSHEVLEHVQNDRQAVKEIARLLRSGGRAVIFVPNRGYPFETHGIYWRGVYHFGNIPLVNYLPRRLRDRLAPHVRVYTASDLRRLLTGLPLHIVEHRVIFGAYDNIIAHRPRLGHFLRKVLQAFEKSPLQGLGLSHFWVIEKIQAD